MDMESDMKKAKEQDVESYLIRQNKWKRLKQKLNMESDILDTKEQSIREC